MEYKKRLEEYVKNNKLYQDYLQGEYVAYEDDFIEDLNQYEIQLCKDIDSLLTENENLLENLEYWKEKYKDLENSLNNDYDPEIEVPEIHKEGVSW